MIEQTERIELKDKQVDTSLICILTSDGAFDWMSSALEQLSGLQSLKLRGDFFIRYVFPPDREALNLKENGTVVFRLVKGDNRLLKLSATVLRLNLEHDNEQVLLICRQYEEGNEELTTTASDTETISSRDLDKLLRKNKQLEAFNQMISHNMRSPLTNSFMLLYNLEKLVADNPQAIDLIVRLKHSNQIMQSMLEELTGMIAISGNTAESRKLNVEQIIQQTASSLQELIAEAGVSVQIKAREWTEINYPEVFMKSIILNLFTNSIKYRRMGVKPEINISLLFEKDKKLLVFSDNGIGIDLKQHGHAVFRLNKTFSRDRQGTGLGLFMTRNQVEAMDGEIRVESEPGSGTTFFINFDKFR